MEFCFIMNTQKSPVPWEMVDAKLLREFTIRTRLFLYL